MWRHMSIRGEHLFYIEGKTQTGHMLSWQLCYHADYRNILALPCSRQAVGQALLRNPCGIKETKPTGQGGEQQVTDKALPQHAARQQQGGSDNGGKRSPDKIR